MSGGNCPSGQELSDYLLGKCPAEVLEGIATHIEQCSQCQTALTTLAEAEDTLVAELRRPAVVNEYAEEPACRELMARAEGIIGAAEAGVPQSPDGGPAESPAGDLGRLGEYELLAKLGESGMGAVYKARQVRLDKIVALKVLAKARTSDPRAVTRFEREMKAVGRLDHPNIVRAVDARDIEGTTVLVMEYLEGSDLAHLVRRAGPLPVADACEMIRQAALGLQSAHENGLVHRDIKPSNLMLAVSRQRPAVGDRQMKADSCSLTACIKILDFGLALLHAGQPEDGLTDEGQPMGTADYMAPEQAFDSHRVDIRADVYSLGCTLYSLLTGHAPFYGPQYDTAMKKLVAHLQTPAPPATEVRSDIPEGLAAVLERMMAKDPADRFQQPAEVAEALAPLCSGANLAGLLAPDEVRSLATTATYPNAPPAGRHEVVGGSGAVSRRGARSEGAWAWKQFLRRRRVLVAVALGLGLFAIGATAWKWMPVFKLPEVVLKAGTLFVLRDGDDTKDPEVYALTDRHDENELALRPLGPRDDFNLRAEFNRPTHWCLVWIDTKGVVEIAARSEAPVDRVDYPARDKMIGVDPHDPPGTHLILLLVSDRPPGQIEGDLQKRLAGIGPPRVVPGKAMPLGVARGSGSVRKVTANLDPGNFRQVEERLPRQVRWVHQLYLPTQR